MYSSDELGSGLEAASLLQPIHRLHIELLEMIFNVYVEWLIEWYRSTRRFIPCTHVCHTWREVALSSARLWRCIDLTQPEIAIEFLGRSKQAPISIMTPFDIRPYTSIGDIYRRHAEHIHEINVVLRLDVMWSFLTDLGFALPALSALSLEVHEGPSDLYFICAMPNVRVVEISGVALPWDTCTNLTKLSIQHLDVARSPSVSQILTIMMQCPALKFVRLIKIKPAIGAATILQTPIELLHLQTLDLDLRSDHITLHILSCISIPSFATINIFNPVSSLGSVIPRHTRHLHNLSCNEGIILYLSTRVLELRRTRPVERGSQPMLSVKMKELSDTVLSSLVEIFGPLKVATLEVSGGRTRYIMNALLHSFLTCLTTLEVGYAGSGFFKNLIRSQETLSSTLHNGIIFPQLKTIIIQRFSTANTGLDLFIAWLKQRDQFGVRLHRLELNDCEVRQDVMHVIDELKMLVDEMVVVRKNELEEGAPL